MAQYTLPTISTHYHAAGIEGTRSLVRTYNDSVMIIYNQTAIRTNDNQFLALANKQPAKTHQQPLKDRQRLFHLHDLLNLVRNKNFARPIQSIGHDMPSGHQDAVPDKDSVIHFTHFSKTIDENTVMHHTYNTNSVVYAHSVVHRDSDNPLRATANQECSQDE